MHTRQSSLCIVVVVLVTRSLFSIPFGLSDHCQEMYTVEPANFAQSARAGIHMSTMSETTYTHKHTHKKKKQPTNPLYTYIRSSAPDSRLERLLLMFAVPFVLLLSSCHPLQCTRSQKVRGSLDALRCRRSEKKLSAA